MYVHTCKTKELGQVLALSYSHPHGVVAANNGDDTKNIVIDLPPLFCCLLFYSNNDHVSRILSLYSVLSFTPMNDVSGLGWKFQFKIPILGATEFGILLPIT